MNPIYIASKGRAKTCSTARMLVDEGTPFYLVVEPQDAEAYQNEFHSSTIIVLPENNKGITYARNQILDFAFGGPSHWFWMLDDDIKYFHLVQGDKKTKKCSALMALKTAEKVLCGIENLAVGALEYQQYAWAAKKEMAMNSYCDVAVLINIEMTSRIHYREDCKEDRDFVLQCLSMGYQSARSTWTAFSVPKNGSNKGGLHDAYKSGLEKHWSSRMVKLWPGICEHITKNDGRPDVKIHWKRLIAPLKKSTDAAQK